MSANEVYTAAVPIYAYRCTEGHEFEVMQRMTDEPLTVCEECGAPVTKLLSAPAIHFKGSGFYNTDYGRRNGARGGDGAGGDGAASGGDKTPAKSESGAGSASSPAGGGTAATGGTSTGGTKGD